MAETEHPSMYNSILGDLEKRNSFTVHNLNGRRYYSSIDAAILFNGYEVDEIVQITWTMMEATLPLFGYNSYVWDEMAKGSRSIEGAFAINFVVPDYLNMVLAKSIKDGSFNTSSTNHQMDKHAPVWKNCFDISVNYGKDDARTGKAPLITLEDVYVKSCGQAQDTQGQALVEVYQFMARDFDFTR